MGHLGGVAMCFLPTYSPYGTFGRVDLWFLPTYSPYGTKRVGTQFCPVGTICW
jgi:hypothetical protein